jgi:hypothetical protein
VSFLLRERVGAAAAGEEGLYERKPAVDVPESLLNAALAHQLQARKTVALARGANKGTHLVELVSILEMNNQNFRKSLCCVL